MGADAKHIMTMCFIVHMTRYLYLKALHNCYEYELFLFTRESVKGPLISSTPTKPHHAGPPGHQRVRQKIRQP